MSCDAMRCDAVARGQLTHPLESTCLKCSSCLSSLILLSPRASLFCRHRRSLSVCLSVCLAGCVHHARICVCVCMYVCMYARSLVAIPGATDARRVWTV
jgi:hypothetical protein